MSNALETKLSLTSENILGERLDALRGLFPEVFAEGKVDFERLRSALGDNVDTNRERYGLSWSGKSSAVKSVQIPSVGTLQPRPSESINFDVSENLLIEGDNLEVLKLLQKSYYGKIKMIYIDPPYNTGNEFLYPDNFVEGLDSYLKFSGQTNEEGVKQTTDTEASGRFHSRWLSMMYPRLFLSRNLLKDDGVIFVSIDDNEVNNLRALMNEVFGEENFIASVIWQKVYSPKNSAQHFSDDHEYILVYARDAASWRPELLPRTAEMEARYINPDGDARGSWKPGDLSARNYYGQGTYAITCPSGRVIAGPPSGRYWVISKQRLEELDADNRIWWGEDGSNAPSIKRFLSEVKQGRVPQTLWKYQEVGHTQDAKKELLRRVTFASSDSVFDTPKPVRLIKHMLHIGTKPNEEDLVLDFFAGSGTTGEAVMTLNEDDGGNRRFILIQLPEPTRAPDYTTIADITRERMRSVIFSLDKADKGGLELGRHTDRGFKAFRLASSNFQIWDPSETVSGGVNLVQQLELFAEHVKPNRSQQDILYELILKAGLPLSARIEILELGGQKVYVIEEKSLVICLENPVTYDCLHEVTKIEPERVICLDTAFLGNDKLKTNVVLEMKSHGITFRTV